jgi:hypothetical protein
MDEVTLSILALKAFCILTKNETIGPMQAMESEWQKFLRLSKLAEQNKDLLKTILKG